MVALAFFYLILFAIQVLAYPLPSGIDGALSAVQWVIWAVFIVDLITRTVLAPKRLQYLVKHPIDVLAVALPSLRGLRVLRVLTAGQWLLRRGSRLAYGRTAAAVAAAVVLIAAIAALAVLDAERGAEGANINNFGDAVWWSFVTMSTVGYGDVFPVTFSGRAVAIGLMIVGISLLGLVSAGLASSFISIIRGEEEADTNKILAKLEVMETEIRALRAELRQRDHDPATERRG
jgi:voltage-gated potassium channel